MPPVRKADYTVGVVGLGRMGANIARHLKDVGVPVHSAMSTWRVQLLPR